MSVDYQMQLLLPITSDEIRKKVIKSININKSPDPDGYGDDFFRDAWDVIGPDMCDYIHDFL